MKKTGGRKSRDTLPLSLSGKIDSWSQGLFVTNLLHTLKALSLSGKTDSWSQGLIVTNLPHTL